MAKDRYNVHVVYREDPGHWAVVREGANRATQTFDNKQPAIDFAKQKAKNNKPSEVKIHRTDGTFQEDRGATYRDDPMPPEG